MRSSIENRSDTARAGISLVPIAISAVPRDEVVDQLMVLESTCLPTALKC